MEEKDKETITLKVRIIENGVLLYYTHPKNNRKYVRYFKNPLTLSRYIISGLSGLNE